VYRNPVSDFFHNPVADPNLLCMMLGIGHYATNINSKEGTMPKGTKAGGVNKLGAVREVIKKHGKDVMPTEIVKLVKTEHGADISVDVASNYKSTALKQLGLKGTGKRKGKRGPKPGWKLAKATANGAPAVTHTKGGGISLEDIGAVKKLVDQIGAEKVKQLALVLAK
jgi:hypothetical protein